MRDEVDDKSPALLRAFSDYEREVRIQNYRVGCVLGIVFMPAGVSLDYFVYPAETFFFLKLRLWCSALLLGVWGLLKTAVGRKFYRPLGLIEVALPLLFISGMIYIENGPASTYYAGLNLVVMGAGIVLRWSLMDSIAVVAMATGMYLVACVGSGHIGRNFSDFFNNVYFLLVTGVFVVTGNYFLHKIRFREFALRHELDENRQRLVEANQKLVELDQVKSRFFANISHELRTPLTLLLAPLESLLNRKDFTFDTQVREWLETMHANGMRLLKLINDLLDLVRLESGKMQVRRESVMMEDFLHGLAISVRKMADDKRVLLTTQVSGAVGSVSVDRDKLEKIILNLVFNAIKFTPAGGRVELHCDRQGEELVLQVIDTGMGIEEKNLPHIFDRFWQADTSSHRKYQGVGIGLALVKELAEVQGGRVEATSEVGKGTTMSVRLPYQLEKPSAPAETTTETTVTATAKPAEPEAVPDPKLNEWLSGLYRRAELFPAMTSLQATIRPQGAEGPAGLPRLLVADDEPDMLRFLKSQLIGRYQVIEAVDGHQAVELASQYLPDAILCDMMMPEKDGLQVCRELRERTPTRSIPIILLTARADEETKLAALSAGASDFLSKPFSSTELHVRLANLVTSSHAQRQVSKQNQILEATLEQLKETETQLVQTEKMASLGRMSAGIIHEINNPLNYAKTGLYALKSKGKLLPDPDRELFEEVVKDIEEGVDRVKNIVSDLRTFTHANPGMQAEVSVENIVTSSLRFLSHEWKGKVDITQDIPPDSIVLGNNNKLVQVLVNLLQNSLDAMSQKDFGEEKAQIRISFSEDAKGSRLTVWDNGPGITGEVQTKIFDPFFTTKDVGKGMGLGLSICYRILEEHGGQIRVRSETGRFCEFALEFPPKN